MKIIVDYNNQNHYFKNILIIIIILNVIISRINNVFGTGNIFCYKSRLVAFSSRNIRAWHPLTRRFETAGKVWSTNWRHTFYSIFYSFLHLVTVCE